MFPKPQEEHLYDRALVIDHGCAAALSGMAVLEVTFAATARMGQRAEVDQRLTLALRTFAQVVQPRSDVKKLLVG